MPRRPAAPLGGGLRVHPGARPNLAQLRLDDETIAAALSSTTWVEDTTPSWTTSAPSLATRLPKLVEA